jgi:hypothetical protein
VAPFSANNSAGTRRVVVRLLMYCPTMSSRALNAYAVQDASAASRPTVARRTFEKI